MSRDEPIYEANVHDPSLPMVGLFVAEEDALKKYLSGITLPGRRGAASTREVSVYYRWPDGSREIVYPFITIDYLNHMVDGQRRTSVFDLGNVPAVFDLIAGGQYVSNYQPSVHGNTMPDIDEDRTFYTQENHIPIKLFYQITAHTADPVDDRYLMGKMLTDYLHPNPLWLGVDADNTWRRLELVDQTTGDTQETTETSKRLFRKVYTITIEAEIPVEQAVKLVAIDTVHTDIYDTANSAREPVDHSPTSEHTVAIGTATVNYDD